MSRFGNENFKKYCEFIYANFGITIGEAKREILRAKLDKLMARHDLQSYDEYFNHLAGGKNGDYVEEFANMITVNQTAFFRESNHFEYIKDNVGSLLKNNPRAVCNNEIRAWSAACSTGEEPYTLSMVLSECLPKGMRIRVLATDINSEVLAAAQAGFYPGSVEKDVGRGYLDKYFCRERDGYRISDEIKRLVTFRIFNLMDGFPFKDSFDIIFCRNVMIYFDSIVRKELIDRFYDILVPGGLLFIGHSESITGQAHRFRYLHPTVYLKC